MKRLKRLIAGLMCMALLMAVPYTEDAAVGNPLEVTGTQIEPGTTEFTIEVQAKDAFVLSAFDFVVEYDLAVLEVDDQQGTGYDYTAEFKNAYKNGVLTCNDREAYSHVSFAGAMTGASAYKGTVAQIHFKVKAGSYVTSTTVSLQVKTIGTETADGVETVELDNKTLSYSIRLKEATGLAGDVNNDGEVTLHDAQLALKLSLDLISFSELEIQQADMNNDGEVTLADAQIILKKALDLI